MIPTKAVTVLVAELKIPNGPTNGNAGDLAMLTSQVEDCIADGYGIVVSTSLHRLTASFSNSQLAVTCASAIRSRIEGKGRDLTAVGCSVRIGIARSDGQEHGDIAVPNGGSHDTASDLCDLADPGQILTTAPVADDLEPATVHRLAAVSKTVIAGTGSPEAVVELVRPQSTTSRSVVRGAISSGNPTLPATGAIEFGVLGPLVVVSHGHPIDIDGVRRRAILIRLLVEQGRPVRLGRLAEDVWSDAPSPGTPSTLRSHLSLLRNLLGRGRLRSRNGAVSLELRAGELDVAIFESEHNRALQSLAESKVQAAETHFEQALARWRGPALSDVEGHAWALPVTTKLEEQRLDAFEGLLKARLLLGDRQRVVAQAEQAVREHPLREELWGILMLALYRSGRQGDALRAYQRLRIHLGDELGIEPTTKLRNLEHSILNQEHSLEWSGSLPSLSSGPLTSRSDANMSHSTPTQSPDPDAVRLASDLSWHPLASSPTFVGRERELLSAMRLRDQVGQGRLGLLLITGEPGIGKTRLAAEIAELCAAEGDLILHGRCDEEPLSSFQGFRRALGRVGKFPIGQVALNEIGPLGQSLRQIVPELASRQEDPVDQPEAAGEVERFQSFEGAVAFIEALARHQPLVLVLEDMQWADVSTIALLEHLLSSRRGSPVLVISTQRDAEVDGNGRLAEELVGLQRSAEVVRVELRGLSPESSMALVEAAVGPEGDTTGDNGSRLQEYTGGNPFFLQEVAMDIAASRGTLAELLAAEVAGSQSSVPDRLRRVVHWRLMRLSNACKSTLTIAALMGLEFEVGVLQDVCAYDGSQLVDIVDEAVAAGIVVEVAEAHDSYRFIHDLVRQTLDVELGLARRVRLHHRIAQALEARFGTTRVRASEIALHYCNGVAVGSAERAVHFALLAGRIELDQVSYEVAVRHFESALGIQDAYLAPDDQVCCEILLALANAEVKAGHLDAAKGHYSEAFRLGHRLNLVDLEASAALGYGGVLPAGVERNGIAVQLLRTTLIDFGASDTPQKALALGRLAHWEHFSLERESRRKLADDAVRIAERLEDLTTLASCLEYRYWALSGPDDVDHQRATGRRITEIGADRNDDELVLRGMKCELHAHLERGDFGAADQLAVQMREMAERVKQPEYLRLGYMWDSLVAGVQGRFDDAEAFAGQAFAIFRRSGHSQTGAIAVGLSLTWLWLQGRLAELQPLLEAGQTGRSSLGEKALSAWVAVEAGKSDEARTILDGLTPESVVAEDRNFHWWFLMAGLSHTACHLGDAEWADLLYRLIAPYATHNCRVGQATYLGSASLYLGSLARTSGRPDIAVPHLQEALLRHQAMNATPFVALTERELHLAISESGPAGDHRRSQPSTH